MSKEKTAQKREITSCIGKGTILGIVSGLVIYFGIVQAQPEKKEPPGQSAPPREQKKAAPKEVICTFPKGLNSHQKGKFNS